MEMRSLFTMPVSLGRGQYNRADFGPWGATVRLNDSPRPKNSKAQNLEQKESVTPFFRQGQALPMERIPEGKKARADTPGVSQVWQIQDLAMFLRRVEGCAGGIRKAARRVMVGKASCQGFSA